MAHSINDRELFKHCPSGRASRWTEEDTCHKEACNCIFECVCVCVYEANEQSKQSSSSLEAVETTITLQMCVESLI